MDTQLGQSADEDSFNTINTTPLVDVMLVLLIIFLITIPVVTTSVRVELPQEVQQTRQTQPETVIISVDRSGAVHLYDTPMQSNADLFQRLQKFAAAQPQPEVHIRGDRVSDFAAIGRVMHTVQGAGILKVSLITNPQTP